MKYKTKLHIFIRASLYSTLTTAILAWQVTSVNAMFHPVVQTPDQQAITATLMLQRGESLGVREDAVRALIGNPDVTPTNRAILAAYMLGVNINLAAQTVSARNLIGSPDVVPIRRAVLAVAMLGRNLDLGAQLDAARNLLGNEDATNPWRTRFTGSALLQERDLVVGGQGRAILATTLLERNLDLGEHLYTVRDLLGDPTINLNERTRLATEMLNRNVDLGTYLDAARAFIGNPNVMIGERARLAHAFIERHLDLGAQLDVTREIVSYIETVNQNRRGMFDVFVAMLNIGRGLDLGAQGRAILAIAMLERNLDLGSHLDAARALVSNPNIDQAVQARLVAALTAFAARREHVTEAVEALLPPNILNPNSTQSQPGILPTELPVPGIAERDVLGFPTSTDTK